MKTDYVLNIESEKINKNFFIYYIDCLKIKGYKFHHINQMIINTISDRCNLTYEQYMNYPINMFERQLNFDIGESPKLINSLDRKRNHPLIRNHSHIPFNN